MLDLALAPRAPLRDLYLAELEDLYDAERQVLCQLPLLAEAATAEELRAAFDDHYRQTLQHIARLDELFRRLEERPRRVQSRALRALIEDGRARHAPLSRGRALDAALIAVAQRIEHYEIAAYRCARAFAMALDDLEGATLLEQTLEEEGGMDQRLVALALAGGLFAASRGQLPVTAH